MQEEFEVKKCLDPEPDILKSETTTLPAIDEGTIEDKCRACTRNLSVLKYNLFEPFEISEQFTRLSTTRLDPDDLLPKSICLECFHRLQEVESFQKTCRASYDLFVHFIANNLKNDSPETTFESLLPAKVTNPLENSTDTQASSFAFEEVVIQNIKNEDEYDVKSDDDDDQSTNSLSGESDTDEDDTLPSPQVECTINEGGDQQATAQPKQKRKYRKKKKPRKTRVRKEVGRTQDPNAQFTCEKCGDKFDSEIHYNAHLRLKEGKKPYPCQQCTREYVSLNLLEKHIHIEHSANLPPNYECKIGDCTLKFRSKHALTNHQLKKHADVLQAREKRRVVCVTCGKCLSGGTIREHELMHKGLAPFPCDMCPKSFISSIRLEKHKLTHLNIKEHACPICGLKMRSKNDVDGHMNVHTRIRKFPCEHCETAFLTKANLQRHVRTVHFRIKEFVCTYCGESFGQSITLQRHMMLHTGEKPFKCPYCGKGFVQKSKMKAHARNHKEKGDELLPDVVTEEDKPKEDVAEGFRNFACEICDEKMTYKELKSHMADHKRDQKYICEICNTMFKESRSLEKHMQIVHEGIKPHACKFCDKTFGAASTLRNHTRTHTGEKPYHCVHCEKRFITRFALQYHEKKRERDIAKGKIPCSKDGPPPDAKAKRKRKRKSDRKNVMNTSMTTSNSEIELPSADMPLTNVVSTPTVVQIEILHTDSEHTASYNQYDPMLV